jgi:hypothetical protein
MVYVKGILSGLAAIFLTVCVASWLHGSQGISEPRATGLGAVAGGIAETIVSPLFWILAVLFFTSFFAASRIGNKLLRIFLFWIPTLSVSTLGIAILALFTYVIIRVSHR